MKEPTHIELLLPSYLEERDNDPEVSIVVPALNE